VLDFNPAGVEMNLRFLYTFQGFQSLFDLGNAGRAG
jgi:hypothetical protein